MAGRISITESVYRSLTERVSSGAFAPGARIDVNEIAAADGVSPTPVRNALNRLVGAGLLVSHSNEGFFAPLITEQGLRHLYDAHGALLGLAVARAAGARSPPKPRPIEAKDRDASIEQRTAAAFNAVMALSSNDRLCAALSDIALRLRVFRLHEDEAIANRQAELRRIENAYMVADFPELAHLAGAYHRRRIRLASQILAAAHTSP